MTDIKFITKIGLKSAKKAAKHEIEGFLESVYFKEEVLKKYESNKDFKIGDDGTVLFGSQWGLFRGVYRFAKGYLRVNLGDLGEAFPNKELEHWKKYNLPLSKIPKKGIYSDFRNTISRMIYFMNQSNTRIKNYLDKFFPNLNISNKNIFLLDNTENILNNIKKVINFKTTIDEFQSRIIFLNILLIESINVKLINKVFEQIRGDLTLSYISVGIKEIYDHFLDKNIPEELKSCIKGTIVPLKSLELLRKFLLFIRIHHDIIIYKKIKTVSSLNQRNNEINKDILKNFYLFYRYKLFKEAFPNRKYFVQYEAMINESTAFLKLLNKFRNSSSAHGFNSKEYKKIIRNLDLPESEEDYSNIYETLISKVSYDIEHIYFSLIIPEPPILDYYKKYMKGSLKELKNSVKNYNPLFEDLTSYLGDFPEMYSNLIRAVLQIYSLKKTDSNFVMEFGCFIESISYFINEKTQELIDYILEGYSYNKPLTLAHISHIIKNSSKLSDTFHNKVYKFVLGSLKEKDMDVNFNAQHILFCLIEKFPSRLNKEEISNVLKNKKIYYDLIQKYIDGNI